MAHSVIMISFLGNYPNCAKNRDKKFKRAVDSFICNTYQDKELIIVSDGCEQTNFIYENLYIKYKDIQLIKAPKQSKGYPGVLRTVGLFFAKGETISYLDTDDYLAPSYIEKLVSNFNFDWGFCNVYLPDIKKEFLNMKEIKDKSINKYLQNFRWTELPSKEQICCIGTPNIFHRAKAREKCFWKNWNGIEGESEDWAFIKQLSGEYGKGIKVDPLGYYMCHFNPAGIDI